MYSFNQQMFIQVTGKTSRGYMSDLQSYQLPQFFLWAILSMMSKQHIKCEEYVRVTLWSTGVLACTCKSWRQTRKTCAHTHAVYLLFDLWTSKQLHWSVSIQIVMNLNYIYCFPENLEIILRKRCKNTEVGFQIPPRPKGRQEPHKDSKLAKVSRRGDSESETRTEDLNTH